MPTELLHNEPQLIREMQSGCQQAFTALYRHYSPLLYVNILRMIHDPVTAEELVQELFTRIWQKRGSKGISEDFSAYMYRVAQNLVFDFFRRLKKDQVLLQRFRELASDSDVATAEDMLHRQQSMGIINNAIEHLPPQQKKVYKLVKQEGYTYKKAAEDLGISPFTVKEYLALANKSIRNYLLHHSDTPRELMLVVLIWLSL